MSRGRAPSQALPASSSRGHSLAHATPLPSCLGGHTPPCVHGSSGRQRSGLRLPRSPVRPLLDWADASAETVVPVRSHREPPAREWGPCSPSPPPPPSPSPSPSLRRKSRAGPPGRGMSLHPPVWGRASDLPPGLRSVSRVCSAQVEQSLLQPQDTGSVLLLRDVTGLRQREALVVKGAIREGKVSKIKSAALGKCVFLWGEGGKRTRRARGWPAGPLGLPASPTRGREGGRAGRGPGALRWPAGCRGAPGTVGLSLGVEEAQIFPPAAPGVVVSSGRRYLEQMGASL